jgi:hypothetical protein
VPEIRLLRKYAAALDGFDLTDRAVGDVFHVADEVAAMMTREGWGEVVSWDRPARMSHRALKRSNHAKARTAELPVSAYMGMDSRVAS